MNGFRKAARKFMANPCQTINLSRFESIYMATKWLAETLLSTVLMPFGKIGRISMRFYRSSFKIFFLIYEKLCNIKIKTINCPKGNTDLILEALKYKPMPGKNFH
jgi:hypothetical protein